MKREFFLRQTPKQFVTELFIRQSSCTPTVISCVSPRLHHGGYVRKWLLS